MMKVKECDCYKDALNEYLNKKMLILRKDIEIEIKKVLGMNYLGMINDYLSNTEIMEILKQKLGRLTSTFILLNRPVIERKNDLHILHIEACSKLKFIKEDRAFYSDKGEEGFNIPID